MIKYIMIKIIFKNIAILVGFCFVMSLITPIRKHVECESYYFNPTINKIIHIAGTKIRDGLHNAYIYADRYLATEPIDDMNPLIRACPHSVLQEQ